MAETHVPTTVSTRNALAATTTAPAPAAPADVSLVASVPLPTDRSSDFIQNLVRAANGSVGLQDRPFNTNTLNANMASHLATTDNRSSPVSSLGSSSSSSVSISQASIQKESQPLPPLPNDAHDMAPRRSLQDFGHHRGSAIIASAPPTEENLFQIQELARPLAGSSSSQQQLICANPMHDQQYLLVGSGCALHSIDLTLPSDKQTIRTHIQGVAFREIHCLEDIGLVVVVAGRNSNVRCYDYDSIKRLVTYGHSKEGKGRVVEGGKLGPVKNMIQLRVETAALKDDTQGSDGSATSPTGQSRMSRILKGASSSNSPRHRHTASIDRSLLSPPVQSDSSPWSTDADSDSSVKKHKRRPLSLGGLASLAQEHVSNNKQQQQSSSSTPTSPSTASGPKSKRFSQMASYLSQAAVNSNVMAHMTNGDAPSEEAVTWAWDFTKLRHPKDVLGLDFHYTPSTVFMTVLSKTGIDIFSRPKSARGRKAAPWSAVPSNPAGSVPSSATGGSQGTSGNHGEAPPRISINTGGMAASSSHHHHRDSNSGANPYEWKPYKQFYHPEAPGFMTVVKDSQEVTDIILGKGTRACVVSVDDMSVTDLHRQETSSVIHGISRKLGFRSNSLWHSFEKIPFDVPAEILYPAAAETIYGRSGPPWDVKERSGHHRHSQSSSDIDGRSRDDIIQRSSDQRSLHQQEQDELEEAEAQALAMKLVLQEQQQYPPNNNGVSINSSSSSAPYQAHPVSMPVPVINMPSGSASSSKKTKARMVTSDEVLNMAFSKQTTSQLFLATYGSQSRIVDIQGKPQSRVVLDWESFPPQKIEFLKTVDDVYVVGFEKTSIVVFSLTRAKKVKEILKQDLLQAAAAIGPSSSSSSSPPGNGRPSMDVSSYAPYTPGSSPSSSSSSSSNNTSINIKFLGRDNIAEDSLGIFFSYCHPKNGVSICKLCILSLVHDDLELLGYYP
ncbi:hypothetical protein BG006_011311 [Podila minutissima]|uniref:Uncharacterized protein n=1 Tax=Podila minutissima TaxID=64525 RepID=A0A9P5SC27_9FUNG|nr:hypothetical protein BG006_011311 [Podila minutissima]